MEHITLYIIITKKQHCFAWSHLNEPVPCAGGQIKWMSGCLTWSTFGLNITLCCLLSFVCIHVKLCFIHPEFICSLQLTFDPWLSASFHLWTLKAECHFDLNSYSLLDMTFESWFLFCFDLWNGILRCDLFILIIIFYLTFEPWLTFIVLLSYRVPMEGCST